MEKILIFMAGVLLVGWALVVGSSPPPPSAHRRPGDDAGTEG